MILALDPSYSGFGIAVASDDYNIATTMKLSRAGTCYTNIVENHNSCEYFCNQLKLLIDSYPDEFDVIVEYPAFATRSGAYLAILNGYLSRFLRNCTKVKSITLVPPTACNSFTRNKSNSKTYLVDYCKEKGWITKRTSHDECTAIIFVKLLEAIRTGIYKNTVFTWNR